MLLGYAGLMTVVILLSVFRTWRARAWIAGLFGLGLLLIGLAWAAFIVLLGDLYCDGGRSDYGELRWSILPPGPTCTWTRGANRSDDQWGPTPVMSLWLITFIVLGVISRACLRKSRNAATGPAGPQACGL